MAEPRSVLLIGGTSGMGLAAALRFAARGDRLLLVARSHAALSTAAQRCTAAGADRVETVAADVAAWPEVEAAVRHALEVYGRIDVTVLAAATMAYGPIGELPVEVFEQVVRTGVLGTGNVARALLPVLHHQGRGTLIVVNSVLGAITLPNMGTYAAAKWGQRAIVRTLQQELRGMRHVHVCLVSPGAVNTPIYEQAANVLGRGVRPPAPVREPERVAEVIERLADRPRRHVSTRVGGLNPVLVLGFRLLGPLFDRLALPLFRRLATTGEPTATSAGNVLTPRPAGERVHGQWPATR